MFNVEGKIFKGKLKKYNADNVDDLTYFTIVKENGIIVAREIGNNYSYPLNYVNYHVDKLNDINDYYVESLFRVIDIEGILLTPDKIASLCQATEKEINDYLEVVSIINETRDKVKDMERPIYKSCIKR